MAKTSRASRYKKDQYVVCRYRGVNGDVIVGRIDSVRRNGPVILEALLDGSMRMKREDVLTQRNIVVTKAEADSVVAKFKETKSYPAAREKAVELASRRTSGVPLSNGSKGAPKTGKVTAMVEQFEALSDDERRAFAKCVWGDVLQVFGVN